MRGRKPNAIRKYIVLKNHYNGNDDFLIFFKKNKYMIWLKYIYYTESNELLSDRIPVIREEYDENMINKYLLYTSDDLDDVISHLTILAEMNKYNIT